MIRQISSSINHSRCKYYGKITYLSQTYQPKQFFFVHECYSLFNFYISSNINDFKIYNNVLSMFTIPSSHQCLFTLLMISAVIPMIEHFMLPASTSPVDESTSNDPTTSLLQTFFFVPIQTNFIISSPATPFRN